MCRLYSGIKIYPYLCGAQNYTTMPTILFLFGLRFFFYSDEHLPMHVHVKNGDGKELMIWNLSLNYGLLTAGFIS